ncbi:MAG: hypothetical protein ACRDEA_19790 [Microcystaceae cyanobacterium]
MLKNSRHGNSPLPIVTQEKRVRQSRLPQSWWERRCRYWYMRFLRLRGTPYAIARELS